MNRHSSSSRRDIVQNVNPDVSRKRSCCVGSLVFCFFCGTLEATFPPIPIPPSVAFHVQVHLLFQDSLSVVVFY